MKKVILLPMLCLLFLGMSSFSSADKLNEEIFGICSVTITTTNTSTGESTSTTYVSTTRTSAADCQAGANALLNGNSMQSSDFRRSPVLAP
ncbi:MAG: hypothetical protein ACJA2M_001310 [Polaribacter sp.]|jgi:hypothetical protein